ncbi:MAG: hypothetical protein MUE70_02695 [Desulfobacterales bacterium]|jgi:hypothetical protein|nr:hypothetical protein [Desulfobacterales bacterium]
MRGTKKTNSEYIIDTLRTGQTLRSSEITQMVSDAAGKEVKIQDIASIIAKLSNSDKCNLGYFIKKKKTDRGYVYSLSKEALELAPEQIYDLTRKTGKDRFTIHDAIKKFPGLKKHIRPSLPKLKLRKAGSGIQRVPAEGTGLADMAVGEMISRVLKEISEQGGLNVNLNLTVNFTGLTS